MQSVCLSCFRLASAIRVWAMFLGLLWLVPRFAGLGPLTAQAADRYVTPPGGGYGTNNPPYINWADAATNIQWAVNVATNGDTVLVTNGNYCLTNAIIINGTNITLMSVNGRDVTFINGNGTNNSPVTNRCITCSNAGWVINGFTISNGIAPPNEGTYKNYGGGIFADQTGTLVNCTIRSNYALSGGGGIITRGGIISNCIFENNTSQGNAQGAVTTTGSSQPLTIANCLILRNYGGISVRSFDCRQVTIRNCVVARNGLTQTWTGYSGAGIRCFNNTIVENCTIASNYYLNVGYNGGGIGVSPGATNIQIRNCIIYSNYASAYVDWCTNNSTGTVFYSCSSSTTNGMAGSGNITNWPIFVDYSATNYRLAANSPCVNTGTNQDWMTDSVDLDGRSRIRYGTVDMGAYENIHEGIVYKLR